MNDTTAARAKRLAREVFGWPQLRQGQLDAITEVVAGTDTLVVMPTGAGKSAIYQLSGRLIGGTTVIVSPLIALQRDQSEHLEAAVARRASAAGSPKVATLNSTLSATERADIIERLHSGSLEFLFLAPEQLANPEVVADLRVACPALVVVDEAHCVVSWGNDFRPDYRRLGPVVDALGRPPVLALTATAAPPVRADIIEQLRMRRPAVLVSGFDRPNLHLAVRTFLSEDDKLDAVVQTAAELTGPGIVYVGKRRETEELAVRLAARDIRAGAYHAGLRTADRTAAQHAFLDGELDVLVATTAFGMGIDKPDVRFVLHAAVAESLDAYYQEIGRAGRDGECASVVLFYRHEDLGLRRFFSGGGVDEQVLRRVYHLAGEHRGQLRATEIATRTGLSRRRVTSAINVLEQVEAVALDRRGRVGTVEDSPAFGDVVRAVQDVVERREAFDATRLEMMRGYAEATTCRRQLLLSYFGDDPIDPCGNCDNCDAGRSTTGDETAGRSPFGIGDRVAHREFGVGTIMRFEHPERVVVLFDEQGYRTLSLSLVLDHDLLSEAS